MQFAHQRCDPHTDLTGCSSANSEHRAMWLCFARITVPLGSDWNPECNLVRGKPTYKRGKDAAANITSVFGLRENEKKAKKKKEIEKKKENNMELGYFFCIWLDRK